MRAIILAIATIAVAGFVTGASAQSSQAKMDEMKAKHPRDFAHCQNLASQRGYRLGGGDYEGFNSTMMFIEGCIMGRVG